MRRTLAYHQIGNRYYLLYQIWKCVVVYHLKEIKLSIITCYHPVKRLRATYRYFHKEKREWKTLWILIPKIFNSLYRSHSISIYWKWIWPKFIKLYQRQLGAHEKKYIHLSRLRLRQIGRTAVWRIRMPNVRHLFVLRFWIRIWRRVRRIFLLRIPATLDSQRIPILQQQKEAIELERACDEAAVGKSQQGKIILQFLFWAKQENVLLCVKHRQGHHAGGMRRANRRN